MDDKFRKSAVYRNRGAPTNRQALSEEGLVAAL
jgi:hypothetical protein